MCYLAGDGPSAISREGVSSCGSRALEHRLSGCGARASLPCGVRDAPESGPGLRPLHEQVCCSPLSRRGGVFISVCSERFCLFTLRTFHFSSDLCVWLLLFFFPAVLHSLWGLSSLGRD